MCYINKIELILFLINKIKMNNLIMQKPKDWVKNPIIIKELNNLFNALKYNPENVQDDWECRIVSAMSRQKLESAMSKEEPTSWIDCNDIITLLNRVYGHIRYSETSNINDWECHLADSMHEWAGMEKFFNSKQDLKTKKRRKIK